MPSSHQLKPYSVTKRDHGKEIARFLADELGISMRKAKGLLDAKSVWVNQKRVWMARHTLRAGDTVEVRWTTSTPASKAAAPEMKVLFEDAHLLAINKPAGLISESHPRSVEARLRKEREDPRLRALHRLDKETSGILLFLKGGSRREPYIELFRDQAVRKQYAVLLAGSLGKPVVEIRNRLDGKEAQSAFTRNIETKGYCFATCEILTGRTHQIRRHAIQVGCRVLGETRYKGGPPMTHREKTIPRQMLHAERIRFLCPHTGAALDLRAPWPEDFTRVAKDLNLLPL